MKLSRWLQASEGPHPMRSPEKWRIAVGGRPPRNGPQLSLGTRVAEPLRHDPDDLG
jgi:hypothetical protein